MSILHNRLTIGLKTKPMWKRLHRTVKLANRTNRKATERKQKRRNPQLT